MGIAIKDSVVEVGQTHSSEEAHEQNQTKFGGGESGAKVSLRQRSSTSVF